MSKCVTCGVHDAEDNGRCAKCNGVNFTPTELSFWRIVKYIEQEHPVLFGLLDIPRLYSDIVVTPDRRGGRP